MYMKLHYSAVHTVNEVIVYCVHSGVRFSDRAGISRCFSTVVVVVVVRDLVVVAAVVVVVVVEVVVVEVVIRSR